MVKSRQLYLLGSIFIIIGSVILLYSSCTTIKPNIKIQEIEEEPTKKISEETKFAAAKKVHKWLNRTIWNFITKESKINNVDPGLTAAIIWHESEGKSWAKGKPVTVKTRSGYKTLRALGLMQVMPFHYKGNPKDLHNAQLNIKLGTKIIGHNLKRRRGNTYIALKDYNSGPGSNYYNKKYINGILRQYNQYKENLKQI